MISTFVAWYIVVQVMASDVPRIFTRKRYLNIVSRGSSVSTVSGYGLDDRAIEVRSPAEAKGFFL
jgi:hypothetical protein